MTEVDISLLIAALLVCLISIRNPRGILWIGIAALSYINGDIAWRLNLPYAEAITGMGDACVCLCLYFAAKQRWELMIWRLFQTSVAVSMLYLAGNLGVFLSIPHEFYAMLMESANWLLLAIVGGTSAMQWIGATYDVGARGPVRGLDRVNLALRQSRTTHSFIHKAHR